MPSVFSLISSALLMMPSVLLLIPSALFMMPSALFVILTAISESKVKNLKLLFDTKFHLLNDPYVSMG